MALFSSRYVVIPYICLLSDISDQHARRCNRSWYLLYIVPLFVFPGISWKYGSHVSHCFSVSLSSSLGIAGLAVTYGLSLNMIQTWVIWNLCHLENGIISVERILQYTNIPSEPPLVIDENRPDHIWPSKGEIDLLSLQVITSFLRYSLFVFQLILHLLSVSFHYLSLSKMINVITSLNKGLNI